MSNVPKPLTSGSVVEKEGTGSLNVQLHPLVIINISDHWTRVKVQTDTKDPRVIGALLGTQAGRNIEILNSFELVYDRIEGSIIIQQNYLNTKLEQFKKVFPHVEFLGWYSTGSQVQPADIEVHKQLVEVSESPLYLLLDTVACANPATRDLPVEIYESELRMVSDKPTMLFVKVPFRIETQEAERISVDHIARITASGGSAASQLTSHFMGVHNAITMLNTRVNIILKYLEAVKAGKSPLDHSLLRRISCLCNQLPITMAAEFKKDFTNEYNDALMITYLASITKGTTGINDLIDKFNITYDKHNRRRGLF